MTRKEELLEAVHGNTLLIPLVNDMVYLEEQLEYLQTLPKIRIHPDDPSKQKATPAACVRQGQKTSKKKARFGSG